MGLKVRYNQCYKPNCRCMKGGPRHGPYLYEQRSEKGKKRHYYLLSPGRVKPKVTCPVCDKEFRQKKPWHSYCTKKCKRKAYYQRRKAYPELYGSGKPPQKGKSTMKKHQDQPPAQPAPTEAPASAPAPTLAGVLLATIQEWQKTHALTEDQILIALETVWQGWDK